MAYVVNYTFFFLAFLHFFNRTQRSITEVNIKLLEYKPSTIAASALIYESRELCLQQYSMLRASVATCEYLDEDSLTKCIDLMQEMVMWMEANKSTIDTSFLSIETPVSVLEKSIKRPELALQ
ncbi:hypothetical protein Ahy_B02g057975 [Arachis hypogaea]|uniref:Cyclin C-terminal domain-containing protein n=1 Tax=Arachis hypogaea TaxID=3818 RepID=A0A445ADH7_ARAHY|nr:hypothetical protein Ahy_B02g057975 [Arachis hypogaea]